MTNSQSVNEMCPMSWSFVGCGFLSFYYLGVISCLRKYSLVTNDTIFCGASSGALIALTLCANLPLDECTALIIDLVNKVGAKPMGLLHPSVDLNKIICERLTRVLPEDCHKRVNGRLYISVTRVSDGKNQLTSQFDSKEELIKAILCSCYLPLMCGLVPPKFRGTAYIDGALSNNAVKVTDNTIFVTPWSGESDICPLDDTSIPIQIMFYHKLITLSPMNIYRITRIAIPPHLEIQSKLCRQGFDDTLRYLQRSDKILCKSCLSIELRPNYSETNNNQEQDSHIHCKDCEIRRQISTVDSIPDSVIQAIDESCDQLNKGFINRFIRHTSVKLVSIIFAPILIWTELLAHLLFGESSSDWSPETVPNIIKTLKIMIASGLTGKYQ